MSNQPDTSKELINNLRKEIADLEDRNKQLEDALKYMIDQSTYGYGEYKTHSEWEEGGMTVLRGERGIKLDDGKYYFESKQVANISKLSKHVRESREARNKILELIGKNNEEEIL